MLAGTTHSLVTATLWRKMKDRVEYFTGGNMSRMPTTTMAALAAVVLSSCASMGEEIFTHQNEVGKKVADLVMYTSDPKEQDKLYRYEEELNAECLLVQQAATKRMEGKSTTLIEYIAVFLSLEECRRKTEEVHAKLPK